MGLSLVTPPAIEPVSLDDLKTHLRIFDSSEEGNVTRYAISARQTMESSRYPGLNICLITQTWDFFLDAFPAIGDVIVVPKPPLQTVTITYTDALGNVTTMDPATYIVDNSPELGPGTGPARIGAVNGWPAASLQAINGVRVRFVAGFGTTPDTVPMNLQIALMMLAGTAYENREATGDAQNPKMLSCVPFGYDSYVGLYRPAGLA